MKIFIDIETIPGQNPELQTEITSQFSEIPQPEEPRCPRNIKKAETIRDWEENTLPGLREAALQKYHDDVIKRDHAIEEAWRKTALFGDQGEIVCIGWAIEDGEPNILSRGIHGSEYELLESFFTIVASQLNKRPPSWVGHNVTFDLRFLFHRAVILGVKPCLNLYLDSKPFGERIQDTMIMWAGLRDKISLDRLCRALGIQTKGDDLADGEYIDGSLVWDFIKRGEVSKVATYCKADVIRCREVYKRMTFSDKVSYTTLCNN